MKILKTTLSIKGRCITLLKKVTYSLFSLLFVVSINSNASAQNLAKFKECAGDKGVESIPYSSEKSTAQSAETAKDRAMTEAKSKFGVAALTDHVEDAEEEIEKEEKVLETAKKNLDYAKRTHPAVISAEEDAVEKSEEKLKKLKEKLKDVYQEVKYGMEHWNQVVEERKKVYAAFATVISKLDRSKSNPEDHIGRKPSDPDDLKEWQANLRLLEEYIDTIKGKMVTAQRTHDDARKDAERAVDNLEDLLP